MKSGHFVLQRILVTSIVLGLSGFGLALEGFYLADASGLLFGDYICMGGLNDACLAPYLLLRSIFWLGIYLLLAGLGMIFVGGLLLRKVLGIRREWKARLFESRAEKRFILVSAFSAFVLFVFFLAP
ncbi:hypothetical protein J2P12_07770, partial [Candidatus Bathyarchaeota archaeon]|nr:hypothetical protein [Candidatus Bathyarchaeota archaeon]